MPGYKDSIMDNNGAGWLTLLCLPRGVGDGIQGLGYERQVLYH